MIAPVWLLVAVLVAIAMALSIVPWVIRCGALLWIVALRPRYATGVVLLTGGLSAIFAVGLWTATGLVLFREAIVLGLWISPFLSLPALTIYARARSKGLPQPIAPEGEALRPSDFVFNQERAMRRLKYRPPATL